MPSSDVRRAIIAWLSAPRRPLISQGPPASGGWRSSIHRPDGEDADPDGVSFIKERAVPGHQLHFVRFVTRSGDLDGPRVLLRGRRSPSVRWSSTAEYQALISSYDAGKDPDRQLEPERNNPRL
jgi:hypothetical protein